MQVSIVGGGPAGCAAAVFLAARGHDVRLIAKPPDPESGALAVSIPPSTTKLIDRLGLTAAFDRLPAVRSSGNTVWWGRDEMRVEPFAGGECGWQVRTTALASALQRAAQDAGVRIEHGRYAPADAAGDAGFTLDCSGRAGVLARRWRVYERAHRTVALIGVWRPHRHFDLPDQTHTLVESYVNGWAWSVPDAAGRRHVAVMVDPRTSDLERGGAARGVYAAEVAKTRRLAALLEHADLEEGPTGWDASMYSASRYVDGRLLLVGDAASFLDPISSAGVKKALASGWLAAVAVHTALKQPDMADTAFAFFAAREVEMYARFRETTRRVLAAAAAGHPHPFWRDRAEADDLAPAGAAEEERIRAALARLRAEPALRVARAPGVGIAPRPAVSGSEIVLEPRLITHEAGDGVRYLHGVDVVAMLELAPVSRQVPDAFEEYCRRHGPIPLPGFLTALATALARGWLVWR